MGNQGRSAHCHRWATRDRVSSHPETQNCQKTTSDLVGSKEEGLFQMASLSHTVQDQALLFKPVVFQLSYALESPGCPGHISVPKSEIFRDGSQAPSLGSSSDNSMMQPRLRVTAVGCPGVEPSSFPFSGQLGLALILVEWVVY